MRRVYLIGCSMNERVVAGALDDAVADGVLRSETVERWRSGLQPAESVGDNFATFLGFIGTGQKPG